MYRFAVVEDNPEFTNTLSSYFQRIKDETSTDFQLKFFDNGEDFIENFNKNYDAIFLDIMLPGENGMNIAKKIREVDSEVTILFVTNMTQYAINGYEVNALDYILKPLSYPDFKNATLKVLNRMNKRQSTSITISNKDGIKKIFMSDIYYVEVQGHTVSFYTDHGVVATRGTLKETEAALAGQNFSKCSNSFLVNLKYVTALTKTDATVGPHVIPVSRRSYNSFSKELTDYIGRQL